HRRHRQSRLFGLFSAPLVSGTYTAGEPVNCRYKRGKLRKLFVICRVKGQASRIYHEEWPMRIPVKRVIIFVAVLLTGTAVAGGTCWTMDQLTQMSWCELEDLYRKSPSACVPEGY